MLCCLFPIDDENRTKNILCIDPAPAPAPAPALIHMNHFLLPYITQN
jgi:hypothetical protein